MLQQAGLVRVQGRLTLHRHPPSILAAEIATQQVCADVPGRDEHGLVQGPAPGLAVEPRPLQGVIQGQGRVQPPSPLELLQHHGLHAGRQAAHQFRPGLVMPGVVVGFPQQDEIGGGQVGQHFRPGGGMAAVAADNGVRQGGPGQQAEQGQGPQWKARASPDARVHRFDFQGR
jgi:hypothetical protein